MEEKRKEKKYNFIFRLQIIKFITSNFSITNNKFITFNFPIHQTTNYNKRIYRTEHKIKRTLRTHSRNLKHIQNLPLILAGDFNARHLLWHDTISNSQDNLLADIIDNFKLDIHNDKQPTCIRPNGNSIIDLTKPQTTLPNGPLNNNRTQFSIMYPSSSHSLLNIKFPTE